MAAQRFGGKYSPDAKPTARGERAGAAVPQPHRAPGQPPGAADVPAHRCRCSSPGSARSAAAARSEMLGELGGFAGLMLSAWLLNEGLRAEEAYAARAVARPPAIPSKLFAAVLTGASIFAASLLAAA